MNEKKIQLKKESLMVRTVVGLADVQHLILIKTLIYLICAGSGCTCHLSAFLFSNNINRWGNCGGRGECADIMGKR